MGWSSLFALAIASTFSLFGFSVFLINSKALPLLQIAAVALSLISSGEGDYFEYFGADQAIYLTTIYIRLAIVSNKQKIGLIVWIASCMYWPYCVFLGEIWIFRSLYQSQKKAIISIRLNIWIMSIGVILKILSFLIPWNFILFINLLWSIIFFPIILLIIQVMPQKGYIQVTDQ